MIVSAYSYLAESVEKLLFTADSRGTARTGGLQAREYAKVSQRGSLHACG